jgi:GT2 family glycosyltransferase
MKNYKIAVVIPTHNRKDYLKVILDQLKEQTYNQDKLVIVIVNDGSADGTEEMLRKHFPDVHIVEGDGNWWYTKSMNQGFTYLHNIKPDLVLTLNDDVEIEPDYLTNITSDAYNIGLNGIMGSVSFDLNNKNIVKFAGIKKINWWRNQRIPYITPYTKVNYNLKGIYLSRVLPGRGMLIPYKILRELNYFDERFVQYGSDDDFCLRAQKKGYKTYISWNAKIYSEEMLTGTGSPIIKQSLWSFTKNLFNKYSPTSVYKDLIILKRNVNPLGFPLAFLINIIGKYYSYTKYLYK